MSENLNFETDETRFGRVQGDLLRSTRIKKNMTLHDVEVATSGEFKIAGLSAYERGERSVPTVRLLKLAALYEVELSDLLPANTTPELEYVEEKSQVATSVGSNASQWGGIRIDLSRLEQIKVPGAQQLRNFVQNVLALRGETRGRYFVLRNDDLLAVAVMFGSPVDQIVEVLSEFGLASLV